MKQPVNVHEAKSSLSKLLERVESGERIVIARNGRPVADLVPHRESHIVFGSAAGQISVDDDSFDDVDDDILARFHSN